MTARRLFKLTVSTLLYYSGLLWVYAYMVLRGRAVVLTYHRVLPKERQSHSFSNPSIVVTPATFDRHMGFLRRFMRPISIDEFAVLLRDKKRIPPRTCLVTFDDGWYDNLEFALPILRRHRVPATLFVATSYIESDRSFWQERLARLLFRLWRQRESSGDALKQLALEPFSLLTEDEARARIASVIRELKAARDPARIAEFSAGVTEATAAAGVPLRPDVDEDRFLRWADLAEMMGTGIVTIGSHAVSHTPLDQLGETDVVRELRDSRLTIRNRLGCDPTTFAYPNGDFDTAAVEAVRSAGYELAFTTQRGTVNLASDRLLLRRINIHESAAPTVAALLGQMAAIP